MHIVVTLHVEVEADDWLAQYPPASAGRVGQSYVRQDVRDHVAHIAREHLAGVLGDDAISVRGAS